MWHAGDVASDEVVLLIVRLVDPDEDVRSDNELPRQSLRDFTRISLQPNQTTTVELPLHLAHFQHALTDDEGDVQTCTKVILMLYWLNGEGAF